MLRPLLTSVSLAIGVFCVSFPDDEARLPVPEKKEADQAIEKIKQIFRADFAKTKPTDRTALAKRLLDLAVQTKDDPTARFAILSEARELAARAGDPVLYLSVARQLNSDYRISLRDACGPSIDLPASTVGAAGGGGTTREQFQALIDLIDVAIEAGDFSAAVRCSRSIETAARKSVLPELAAGAQIRTKSLPTLQRDFAKLAVSFKTLESKPADPTANDCVGRYLCFVKRSWDEGLPHLLLGDDPKLRDAVTKDIGAAAGGPRAKVDAAEAWRKLSANMDPIQQSGIEARSLHWFQTALPNLGGLEKALAERQIKELAKSTALVSNILARAREPIVASKEPVVPKAAAAAEIDLLAGGLAGIREPKLDRWLQATEVLSDAQGVIIKDGPGPIWVCSNAKYNDRMMTKASFRDIDLHVEFLLAAKASGAIKFQNLYEVHLADRFGKAPSQLNGQDCGGVYPRAEITDKTYRLLDLGVPPKVNACKRAGEWQTMDIEYRAPRFDKDGSKIANALLVKATLNGQLVQELTEFKTPTGAGWMSKETAQGSLALQADGEAVAFKNVKVRERK